MEAYCMKCKQKREMENPVPTFTATGTPMTRGVCPVCGTNIIKMGKKYTKVILQIIKKKEKEKDITLMGIII